MLLTQTKLVAMGLLLGVILTGCGDSGGGSSISNLSDAEAKQVAMESLAKVVNTVTTAADGVDSTVMTSRSMQVVTKTGIIGGPAVEPLKQKFLARMQQGYASAKQRVVSTRSRSVALRGGLDAVDANEIATYLVFKSRDGNVITYTLNPDTVCAAGDTTCLANLQHITLVQTIETTNSGTLDVRVYDHIAFTIGYAANAVYLQLDLAELKAIADFSGTAMLTDITAFEGQLRLTLTVLSDVAAAEKVSVGFGIPKAIKVAGKDNGQAVSLDVAASDTVIALTADAGADTATIEFGLGMVHLLYLDDITPTVFHLGGLTGLFTFSGDTLTATGVGIGGEIYSDAAADGTKDDRVTLGDFGFTVDGLTDTLTLDTAFALHTEVLAPAAALDITVPAKTALTATGVYPVWKVTAGGPVHVVGTGTAAGELSVVAGTCFRENPVPNVFPIVAAGCL